MSVAAQSPLSSNQPAFVTTPSFEPTMMQVVPYPDEAPAVPYSCYRIGRCSLRDLYYFAGRPNRLTRLAPQAPAESDQPPSIQYQWFFAPVTPEENILPKYRAASQVRDEYR